jgi:hypothetical protein
MPFDTFYIPGARNVQAARIFTLRPGQQIAGVSLRLPKPLLFGDLYVDVKWRSGLPAAGGARAFADWNGVRADFQRAPIATNRVKLRLALNRQYEIRVDWIDPKPGKFLFVEGAAGQRIDFTRDGESLEIQLKTEHP